MDIDALVLGQEVLLNDALNIVEAAGFEQRGDIVMLKEIPRAACGHWSSRTPTRSRWCTWPIRCDPNGCEPAIPFWSTAARVRVRTDPEGRGRGVGPRRGARHRLRGHRWPQVADRADPRRRRVALHARISSANTSARAQGDPALRSARLRKDAHREGRQLPGEESLSPGGFGGRAILLPQHQGPGTAEQVVGRPSGTSDWSSSGPGRRPARACR